MICETHLVSFGLLFMALMPGWMLFFLVLSLCAPYRSFLLYVAGLGIFVFGLAFIVVYIPVIPCLMTRKSCVALSRLAFITVHVLGFSLRPVPPSVSCRSFVYFSLSGCCHYCRLCSTLVHQPFLAISGKSCFIVAFAFRPVHIYAATFPLDNLV
jgi:hypothetical protein